MKSVLLLIDTNYNDLVLNNTIASINKSSNIGSLGFINSSILNSTYANNITINTQLDNLNNSLKNSTNVLSNFLMCNTILGSVSNLCTLTDTNTIYNDASVNATINSINSTNNLRSLLDGTYLLKAFDFSGFLNLTSLNVQTINGTINIIEKNFTYARNSNILLNTTNEAIYGNNTRLLRHNGTGICLGC